MSNILRNRQGNLSKVKYFLPAHNRNNDESQQSQIIKSSLPKKSKPAPSKKPSINNTILNKSLHQNDDLSLQIVGIHEASVYQKQNQEESNIPIVQNKSVFQRRLGGMKKGKSNAKAIEASLSSIKALTNSKQWVLPEGTQKEEFYRFIETLKNDETYQHTITMFTIMYFYEQKRKKTK